MFPDEIWKLLNDSDAWPQFIGVEESAQLDAKRESYRLDSVQTLGGDC